MVNKIICDLYWKTEEYYYSNDYIVQFLNISFNIKSRFDVPFSERKGYRRLKYEKKL
jgi:hypothetical protein